MYHFNICSIMLVTFDKKVLDRPSPAIYILACSGLILRTFFESSAHMQGKKLLCSKNIQEEFQTCISDQIWKERLTFLENYKQSVNKQTIKYILLC